MSDDDSIVFLSGSEDDGDDEVKEIPKDDKEEEEKFNPKEIEFTDKRGVGGGGGIIVQKEHFEVTNISSEQESESISKQDMTTQTDEDLSMKSRAEKSESQSNVQVSPSGNRNLISTVSNKEVSSISKPVKDVVTKGTTADNKSRNDSVNSHSNNGQRQNNANTVTRPPIRYNPQKPRKPIRMYRNSRVQPYNRLNQCGQQSSVQQNFNFVNDYNHFGVPTLNYNNFALQILPVRERYIEQFKEYLRSTFANFLNDILPFNLPPAFNVNFPQGTNNNFTEGTNNFAQGNNYPQGINNFPQGINNLPQGINNLPQGSINFPQGSNNFPQSSNNFPQGYSNNFQQNN